MQPPQNRRLITEHSDFMDIHFESVTDKKINMYFPIKKIERGNNKIHDWLNLCLIPGS